jgi:predicted short-subunit dehydrogenase-like oxidoreductase (DUF2520 family)
MTASQLPWIIIGCGRVGQTLALLARDLGIEVKAIWNRSAEASALARQATGVSDGRFGSLPDSVEDLLDAPAILWLTVVDTHLEDTARRMAARISPDAIVLQTSGSLEAALLHGAGIRAAAASVHPLQAITDPQRALERLSLSTWAVEGDERAVAFATELLARINVEPIRLRAGGKIYYHAAAVTAANLLVSLFDAAIQIASEAQISETDARAMLAALAQSSLDNLREQPPAKALSGPVARGDEPTIDAHRAALARMDDEDVLAIYDLLTKRARNLLGK